MLNHQNMYHQMLMRPLRFSSLILAICIVFHASAINPSNASIDFSPPTLAQISQGFSRADYPLLSTGLGGIGVAGYSSPCSDPACDLCNIDGDPCKVASASSVSQCILPSFLGGNLGGSALCGTGMSTELVLSTDPPAYVPLSLFRNSSGVLIVTATMPCGWILAPGTDASLTMDVNLNGPTTVSASFSAGPDGSTCLSGVLPLPDISSPCQAVNGQVNVSLLVQQVTVLPGAATCSAVGAPLNLSTSLNLGVDPSPDRSEGGSVGDCVAPSGYLSVPVTSVTTRLLIPGLTAFSLFLETSPSLLMNGATLSAARVATLLSVPVTTGFGISDPCSEVASILVAQTVAWSLGLEQGDVESLTCVAGLPSLQELPQCGSSGGSLLTSQLYNLTLVLPTTGTLDLLSALGDLRDNLVLGEEGVCTQQPAQMQLYADVAMPLSLAVPPADWTVAVPQLHGVVPIEVAENSTMVQTPPSAPLDTWSIPGSGSLGGQPPPPPPTALGGGSGPSTQPGPFAAGGGGTLDGEKIVVIVAVICACGWVITATVLLLFVQRLKKELKQQRQEQQQQQHTYEAKKMKRSESAEPIPQVFQASHELAKAIQGATPQSQQHHDTLAWVQTAASSPLAAALQPTTPDSLHAHLLVETASWPGALTLSNGSKFLAGPPDDVWDRVRASRELEVLMKSEASIGTSCLFLPTVPLELNPNCEPGSSGGATEGGKLADAIMNACSSSYQQLQITISDHGSYQISGQLNDLEAPAELYSYEGDGFYNPRLTFANELVPQSQFGLHLSASQGEGSSPPLGTVSSTPNMHSLRGDNTDSPCRGSSPLLGTGSSTPNISTPYTDSKGSPQGGSSPPLGSVSSIPNLLVPWADIKGSPQRGCSPPLGHVSSSMQEEGPRLSPNGASVRREESRTSLTPAQIQQMAAAYLRRSCEEAGAGFAEPVTEPKIQPASGASIKQSDPTAFEDYVRPDLRSLRPPDLRSARLVTPNTGATPSLLTRLFPWGSNREVYKPTAANWTNNMLFTIGQTSNSGESSGAPAPRSD